MAMVVLEVRYQWPSHQVDHSAVRRHFNAPRLTAAGEENGPVTLRFQPDATRPATLAWVLGDRTTWTIEPPGETLPGPEEAWNDWQKQADMALWMFRSDLASGAKCHSVVDALLIGEVQFYAADGNTVMRYPHEPMPKETPQPDGYVASEMGKAWAHNWEFAFELLDGDDDDCVGLIWQADERRWLKAGTYEPVDKDEYPELIRFAEQDLLRIRRAEQIADEWYAAYLLVLINLFPDGVSIEHRRRAVRHDDLSAGWHSTE
ncbi:hypothetical protein [Curtobacterium oceanosedimentum]|uniref:Uncharacterized protein n=1 Tax=Curtobacterium oceanosedimentum TaxID=465820 RepID=A0A147DTQ9_9MICO|nr:hypothetical protein [Curtobacterium oceanosedimentum]KTR53772.1 hypothetical protein NS359_01840 [Curtobacterium oceanosedimentum]